MQIPTGREKIWCILKAFFNQFTDNNSNVICFEDHFNPNSSNLYLSNAIQNLYQNIYPTLLTSSNLNSNWLNYSDPKYIQPVDLALLYPYLAYKYIDNIINVSEFTDHHFMLLWRNKINIALFFRTGYNLDNYASEKVTTNSLQNTFLNLNDYGETNKNLTFYHNVNLNRDIKLDNLKTEHGIPMLKKGIILTAELDKGIVLKDILQKSNYYPKKIIFIDDKIQNLYSVQNVCNMLKIPFQGFHYTAIKYLPTPNVNQKLEKLRFKILENEYRWVQYDMLENNLRTK
jgi:hypothetical protein